MSTSHENPFITVDSLAQKAVEVRPFGSFLLLIRGFHSPAHSTAGATNTQSPLLAFYFVDALMARDKPHRAVVTMGVSTSHYRGPGLNADSCQPQLAALFRIPRRQEGSGVRIAVAERISDQSSVSALIRFSFCLRNKHDSASWPMLKFALTTTRMSLNESLKEP